MNIPEIAIRAAAISLSLTGIREDWEEMSDTRRSLYEHSSEAALNAALPYLARDVVQEFVTGLLAQFKNDKTRGAEYVTATLEGVLDGIPTHDEITRDIQQAARIAEEGTTK